MKLRIAVLSLALAACSGSSSSSSSSSGAATTTTGGASTSSTTSTTGSSASSSASTGTSSGATSTGSSSSASTGTSSGATSTGSSNSASTGTSSGAGSTGSSGGSTGWTYPPGPYGFDAGDIFPDMQLAGVIDTDLIAATRLDAGPIDLVQLHALSFPDAGSYRFALINLCAVWCSPCQQEARELGRDGGSGALPPAWNAEGGLLVSLLMENGTFGAPTQTTLYNWNRSANIDYTSLYDPLGVDGGFSPLAYTIQTFPDGGTGYQDGGPTGIMLLADGGYGYADGGPFIDSSTFAFPAHWVIDLRTMQVVATWQGYPFVDDAGNDAGFLPFDQALAGP